MNEDQRRRSRRKMTDIAPIQASLTISATERRAAGKPLKPTLQREYEAPYTNRFLTRLESLGVKNKNAREAIRNKMVPKPLSMSDMSDIILEFFFIALNSKTEWTLHSLPTEITNKNRRCRLDLSVCCRVLQCVAVCCSVLQDLIYTSKHRGRDWTTQLS